MVPTNLYVLLVAPKGSGKTPASKCFLGPLLDLEQEEIREYDEKKLRKKKRKVGEKRKIEVDDTGDNDPNFDPDNDEDDDGNIEADPNVDSDEKEDGPLSSLFHKKTRICETVTPEALIETLRHNDGCLVIKSDEFKVGFP